MPIADRLDIYRQIEQERSSKVINFVTSDRLGMEIQIAQDCIDLFVDILDSIGPTKKISLILHTNGGQTLAAWRLVNIIRSFADTFEVIIPYKALSSGTLISIGADVIVMSKQAALGPIDPSVNSPLAPVVGGRYVPVSVEAVKGFIDAARTELDINDPVSLANIFVALSNHIHPLVLGDSFRSRQQIRFLAEKLIKNQLQDTEKVNKIIDFLCADSGSHDYTINRREAAELGLKVEKPTTEFYSVLRNLHATVVADLRLREPFILETIAAGTTFGTSVPYVACRGLIESTDLAYEFATVGQVTPVQVPVGNTFGVGFNDARSFEGWRLAQ
jgi:Serine dehydrogenase proteinase